MTAPLIHYVATSLDGSIARPDGRVDWLEPIERSSDDHGYHAFYESIDGLLMGRGTYEAVLAMGGDWPYPGKPCTVLTRADLQPAGPQVKIRHSTPQEALAELAEAGWAASGSGWWAAEPSRAPATPPACWTS